MLLFPFKLFFSLSLGLETVTATTGLRLAIWAVSVSRYLINMFFAAVGVSKSGISALSKLPFTVEKKLNASDSHLKIFKP